MLYRPVEGSVGREGANMALVEDAPWQRHPPPVAVAPPDRGALAQDGANRAFVEDPPWRRRPPPVAVAPPERGVVDHVGRPVNAAGLECRPRVRTGPPAVQAAGGAGA